jgi:ABC-type branched-subunit amino acid transport system substrate-binding protein
MVGGAKALLGSLHGKRVGLYGIASNPAIDESFKTMRAQITAQGGEVVADQRVPLGSPSATVQAANLVAAKPDVVITTADVGTELVMVPALATAGFTGPILGNESAATSAVFEKLRLKSFYAARTFNAVDDSSPLKALAAKYGFDKNLTGCCFAKGWVLGKAVVAALTKCSGDCAPDAFTTAMESLGTLQITPPNVVFGPIEITKDRHYAFTTAQFFSWDPDSKTERTSGQPVDIRQGLPN